MSEDDEPTGGVTHDGEDFVDTALEAVLGFMWLVGEEPEGHD